MDKRDKAILAWFKKHKPNYTQAVQEVLSNKKEKRYQGTLLCLYSGFQAGRTYQFDNDGQPDDPNAYNEGE